ncbi:DUF6252 family protein [Hymenobacter terricola]|uniref:DUF6252 family protein n=1 Tax=Hymenobacter terricola TaxID=2819236 RepID=UPI001B30F400|nr:DUF6252 family protein [Hymenobacter terricola]
MKNVLLVLLVLLASCKKEEIDALPKATQQGKNTFGCLLDGQAFLPTSSHNIFQPTTPLQGYFYRREIGIKAYGEQGQMYLALRDAFRPGTYSLGETSTGNYASLSRGSGSFYMSATRAGSVTLTRIDTVARVMAGTFEFSALDYQGGGTISVTSGRFDVAF